MSFVHEKTTMNFYYTIPVSVFRLHVNSDAIDLMFFFFLFNKTAMIVTTARKNMTAATMATFFGSSFSVFPVKRQMSLCYLKHTVNKICPVYTVKVKNLE